MSKTRIPVATDDRYKVLTAICVCATIIPLVFTGPTISIPAVGRNLGGDQSSLSWIVNAYAIAFDSCMMAASAISDQISRKRCFIAELWIFITMSLLIGLAPNLLMLNLMRAAEGVGGAFVLTSATSLLAQEFEEA
ncbi:MAG: MFS transporter [Candidatus Malihini olakiniferum]